MINYKVKNNKISNAYYNLALDKLKENRLYDASILLKKSLLFNKANANSRNLLGLIFYREGEVVDALSQWVINNNLNKDDPISTYFLNHVQHDEKTKDMLEAIKIYNIALDDIDEDKQDLVIQHDARKDLAMHHLYKALKYNPNHLKSLLLLSLLLLEIKDHIKAGSYLLKAKKIDSSDFMVNKLMDYTMANTKQKEYQEKRLQNIYSDKKIESDDLILPNRYIKLTPNQTIKYLLIGALVGVVGYHTIVTPVIRQSINERVNDSYVKYSDIINDQNKSIRDLTVDNRELTENYNIVSEKVKRYEEQNERFTFQYETLTEINKLFDNGNILEAINRYVSLDKSNITDDNLIVLLNSARSRVESIGAGRICEMGTQEWNAGNKPRAIEFYKLSLNMEPDNPETMFLLARLYQSMGEDDESNVLFDKIIAEHSDSNYARRARDARGY